MQSENEVPDVEVVSDPADDSLLTVRDEPLPPVVPDRATLIRGFCGLAERIPGFTQLTPEETRKMIRLSELDEELIVAALAAADAWDRAQATFWLKMTPDELHELDKTVRDTDDVIRELRVLLRGIEGANRVRKHRRGTAIFGLYRGLQILVHSGSGHDNFMRPYFENMRRAYLKNRKPRKAKANEGGTPPSPDPAGGPRG
ncbi:MAG: hypothetical protein ACXW5U_11440 [Thermoanaerobaculia bacterium]